MNTFANRSLPVQLSLAKLFTFRWQFTDDEAIRKQKDRYLRKIGDLEMQLDFAKRVSKKLGIEIPADD